MNKNGLRNSILTGAAGLMLMNTAQAFIPLWTFTQIPGYPSSVSVSTTGTATIKYTIINQSHKSHTLRMKRINGITPSGCTSPLNYQQSCSLTLTVNGNGLTGDVFRGPELCEQGNPNLCYQPSQADSLAIRLTQVPPVQQYTVTSSADNNGSVNPSGAQTVNSGATLTFTAIPDAGYRVNQWLLDGTLTQTGGTTYQLTNITTNHSVNVTFGSVTLEPSVSTLGLSVNCPSSSTCTLKNDALTGMPRKITITNNGSIDATNVLVSTSGLPSGTLVSPSSCGTIAANGGTCEITVTPGSTVSSNANNTLCTSGVHPEGSVNVTADGGLSTSVDTYVLSYGCIYQGGFIYSVDDTTSDEGGIGGKTAAVTDTYPGQTNPNLNTPNWGGYGTDIGFALYETNPQGANDGSANSAAIISALTTNYSSPPYNGASPVSLSDYAAGLCSTLSVDASGASSCTAPNTCYADWYLPAICELGPLGPECNAGSTNIQEKLFENTLIPSATLGLANLGYYWSSTESSNLPQAYAWYEHFVSGGGGGQFNNLIKDYRFGVRCSRALTF